MQLNGARYIEITPSTTARGGLLHPYPPSQPAFDIIPKEQLTADIKSAKRMTASQREAEALKAGPDAIVAMQGSNADAIQNRRAIRMANLSAAQMLKAELNGTGDDVASQPVSLERAEDEEKEQMAVEGAESVPVEGAEDEEKEQMVAQGGESALDEHAEDEIVDEEAISPAIRTDEEGEASVPRNGENTTTQNGDEDEQLDNIALGHKNRERGKKRKQEDAEGDRADDSDIEAPPNPEADQVVSRKKLKTNPDGTVDGYVDDVRSVRNTLGKPSADLEHRLWEPGYRERYYQQKFGIELSDRAFISQYVWPLPYPLSILTLLRITRSYMEGLCWVLEYYYQGVPAWDWYYPYHYAPFAQDFQDVGKLKIEFDPAEPFKPFAQLLGVFPAAR